MNKPSRSITSKNRRPQNSKNRPSQGGKKNTSSNGKSGHQRKKMVSKVDPRDLIKKATIHEEKEYTPVNRFDDFDIDDKLKNNISIKGYEYPTEIQDKSIPDLLDGRNLIGIAATGTGKTGAFLIPLVNKMISNDREIVLVVAPTRELALQIDAEFRTLVKGTPVRSVCFIGGTKINQDIRKAKQKHQIIIATPGRLNDLIMRKAISIKFVQSLVLDEFDRMLDMGFINDIRKILSYINNRKQTLLFSATVDKSQEKIIAEIVQNPIRINVTTGTKSSDNVDQEVIEITSPEEKYIKLKEILNQKDCEKVFLFAETKRTVDRISKKLKQLGVKADVIHGDKSQNYRVKAIDKFKKGAIQVLVATDVAARGIDIDDVTHVINFQLPLTMDSYIHRIGRTGRAGKTGKAYTFVEL